MYWQEVDGRTTGRLAGLWSLTDAGEPSVAARETRKKYQHAIFEHERLSTPVKGSDLLRTFFDKDYWQEEAWRQDGEVLAAHMEAMADDGDVPMVQVNEAPSTTI